MALWVLEVSALFETDTTRSYFALLAVSCTNGTAWCEHFSHFILNGLGQQRELNNLTKIYSSRPN
jgi:hypothetical protein